MAEYHNAQYAQPPVNKAGYDTSDSNEPGPLTPQSVDTGSRAGSFLEPADDSEEEPFVEDQFQQLYGRLYQMAWSDSTDYALPVDSSEGHRLAMQYVIIKNLIQRTYLAPVRNPGRILDIGTGPGHWCADIGWIFPEAEVIGIDTHIPKEDESLVDRIPENVKFVEVDATLGDWGSKPYSLIHTRMMLGAFADFKQILQRAFDYLEPGGYFEGQEIWPRVYCDDGTIKPGNRFVGFLESQDEAMMKLGKPVRIANKIKNWMEQIGFVDVHEEIYRLPIGAWPKDSKYKVVGKAWAKQLCLGLQAFSLRLFQETLGWSAEEIEVYNSSVRNAINDRSSHGYFKFYVVHGRKPLSAPVAADIPSESQTTFTDPERWRIWIDHTEILRMPNFQDRAGANSFMSQR